jgi:hypothetical protein
VDRIDQWIATVDRTGLLHLTAEGPYVRYGMPRYVTIRRRRSQYEVDWVEAGDGVGVPPAGHQSLDRAGLEDYLRGLLDDERPVRSTAPETRDPRRAIDILLGLLVAGGIVWLLWFSLVR